MNIKQETTIILQGKELVYFKLLLNKAREGGVRLDLGPKTADLLERLCGDICNLHYD
jgi:hypothetical protein